MSAVDEFREYVDVPDSHYLPVLAVVDKATRAIAELERRARTEDEVEQREARRCGTCALWQEWKPGSWDCAEEWCSYSTNPETFGCTHWEQRREG